MMKRMRFGLIVLAVLAASALPARGMQAQPQPQGQGQAQTEFVPVDKLPPQEQMPAAPLVIAAYAVAWVAMFIYLASIWRRLKKVDRELADVARRIAERSRT